MVISTYRTAPIQINSIKLDITEEKHVSEVIAKVKPNVIVHLAAETDVDLCEKEPTYAHRINVEGSRNVAVASRNVRAKMIFISTDYVFDGNKGNYHEEDRAAPINAYGVTKLLGEQEILKYCENHLIIRSSVNFGLHPFKQSFVTWIASSLEHGKRIRVVRDHYNTPTLTNNLAEVIEEAIENDLNGLYHASGTERISRYEFAMKIADKFNLPRHLIEPVEMGELRTLGIWVAKRPSDSSLCIRKIQSKLKTRLINIDTALEIIKNERETVQNERLAKPAHAHK